MRPNLYKKQKGRLSSRSFNRSLTSMKKSIFFLGFIAGLIITLFVGIWWTTATKAPSTNSEEIRFIINRGSSAEKIGSDLADEGLVKSALAFKIYTQLNDYTRNIPPGEFLVPQNLSLEELINHLLKGPEEYWVTIPEGLRREEVVERFIEGLGLVAEEAVEFRSEFLSASKNQEGYLFPDSYLFPPDISAAKVVTRLTNTFDSKTAKEFAQNLDKSNLNLQQAVILASVIERETKTSEERPVVAGIYLNRMEIGMALQADATAQYAMANKRCANRSGCDWWQTPSRADLEIDSPYNTYQITGLPVAPIANPGITSLMAVVDPEASDYFYYIHDDDGQIHYAKTLAKHNANVSRYLR